MFRCFLGLISMLFVLTASCVCQTTTQTAAPTPASQDGATAGQSAVPASTSTSPSPAATTPANSTSPKKVWTNDDLGGGRGSKAGGKQTQQYPMTPSKPADPATVARLKASLEKLQDQLDEVNKKLGAYKQFQEGEPVSAGGQEVSAGYIRTPVNQQMSGLQDKKKKLEGQLDDLWEEARKKGVEPGQLR